MSANAAAAGGVPGSSSEEQEQFRVPAELAWAIQSAQLRDAANLISADRGERRMLIIRWLRRRADRFAAPDFAAYRAIILQAADDLEAGREP
jgi:hypothetical protein